MFVCGRLAPAQRYSITSLSSDVVKLGCVEPIVYSIDVSRPIRAIAFIRGLVSSVDTGVIGVIASGNSVLDTILLLALVSSNKVFHIESFSGPIQSSIPEHAVKFILRQEKLTETQRRLLEIVRKNPGLRIKEIAYRAGLSESTTEKYLHRLSRLRLVFIGKNYHVYPTEYARLI